MIRPFRALLAAAFISPFAATGQSAVWTPPKRPAPQTILRQVDADIAAGRHDVALAKLVWFHEKALSIDRSLYGARLSFALAKWKRLAEVHPPALEKLQATRDAAAEQAKTGEQASTAFHDFVTINHALGDEAKSIEFFAALDQSDPEKARDFFHYVQPALIASKNYSLAAKYINPEADLAAMLAGFKTHQEIARKSKALARMKDYAEKRLTNDAATLVALLTVADRKEEAAKIAEQARAASDHEAYQAAITAALEGTVPEPWP